MFQPISSKDKDILRSLASRVAELAARPIEDEKRELWYDHNELKPTRPLVFCSPENGWNEIITAEDVQCEGDTARGWEFHLRQEVFWGDCMRDDRVIQPFFPVSHVAEETWWGVEETKHTADSSNGAYTWDAPIRTIDDLFKLRMPTVKVDRDATNTLVDEANAVFGDILPVRLNTVWWWTFGLTMQFVFLRGLEQMMMDMIDQPELVHRLMAFLRDGNIARLDYLEQNGLLSLNNDGTYVGSGGFGWSRELPQADFGETVRSQDMWGFAESQETVSISPDMFAEFVFPYQLPILQRFGLNCYGCCEPLDRRWHVVKNIPNLRRVSVSPWCNLEDMAAKLEGKYVFSMKPNPADLAAPTFDEGRIRQNLRSALETTKGCHVELIMKDNHTIYNDPSRVTRWVQIAKEEAERM